MKLTETLSESVKLTEAEGGGWVGLGPSPEHVGVGREAREGCGGLRATLEIAGRKGQSGKVQACRGSLRQGATGVQPSVHDSYQVRGLGNLGKVDIAYLVEVSWSLAVRSCNL